MSGNIFTFKRGKRDTPPTHSNTRETILNEINEEPQCKLLVADTLSASVDLEDIISDYDGGNSITRDDSSGSTSLSRAIQASQTYFSATEGASNSDHHANNDETSSFYSALQDGFSLNNYRIPSEADLKQTNAISPLASTNSHILWADKLEHQQNNGERDSLMSPSHFQVYWSDLAYAIKPKITLLNLWNDLEQRFKSNLSSILDCRRSRKYSVSESSKHEPIKIIDNISGSFKSGHLTAVMGPSGAGKTSLLNFLSRRREEGYSGELYVDTTSNNRIKISTIPQSDHLPEYLTVRENLTFASRLKNAHLLNYDHERNVERVSSLLGLDECLDTRTKKISGGQLKRLAIGQELLSKPDILILDEPTSGLDSLTCYKTLLVLKDLVQASAQKLIDPIAIVLTIHQPQQEVFDLFDKIYILANGGIAIYNGPPSGCVEFVERYSGVKLPDKDYNAASFLIEIASGEYGTEPIRALEGRIKSEFSRERRAQRKETTGASKSILSQLSSNKPAGRSARKSKHPNQAGEESTEHEIQAQELETAVAEGCGSQIDHRLAKGSSMNVGSFWLKTRILILRCWFSMFRDPKQLIGRILFHLALPVAMALFMGTEPGGANACPKFKAEYELKELVNGDSALNKDVQEELFLTLENIGVIFIMMYSLTCANIAGTTLSFTLDMQSSLKEYYNGWYSMPSYLLARIASTLPMEMILPVITLFILYPLSGQQTGNGLSLTDRVLISSLSIILSSMIGQTMGMIVGALYIGHVTTALFASQAVTLPMAFLSGFVVRTKEMSKFVRALSKLSVYKHGLDILSIARYGFDVCECDPAQINGRDAKIVGVPENFDRFLKYWSNSFLESGEPSSLTSVTSNETILSPAGSELDENKLFKLFAKQVSLYNTYGKSVKSCADVVPFQMYDLGLKESDIPENFMALLAILVIIKVILFVTVKLVVHFRTSL